MKTIFAVALMVFGASTAHAGSKSVMLPIMDVMPIYELFSEGGPVTLSTESTFNGSDATVAATAAPRSIVGRTGHGPGAQDAFYANLLKEAQKRGLR